MAEDPPGYTKPGRTFYTTRKRSTEVCTEHPEHQGLLNVGVPLALVSGITISALYLGLGSRTFGADLRKGKISARSMVTKDKFASRTMTHANLCSKTSSHQVRLQDHVEKSLRVRSDGILPRKPEGQNKKVRYLETLEGPGAAEIRTTLLRGHGICTLIPRRAWNINAARTDVINTLVTYDKPWRKIYAEGSEGTKYWMKQQNKKFNWNADWEFPAGTKTMNVLEVARCLKNARTDRFDARFLDYSCGNNDLQKVQKFLGSGDTELGWVLGGRLGIGIIPEVGTETTRVLVLRPRASVQVEASYTAESHRALIDAKKMHIMFKDMVDDSARD